MGIPGLMDYNIKEIDEQYRKASDNIGGYAIINNQPPSKTIMVNCWAAGCCAYTYARWSFSFSAS